MSPRAGLDKQSVLLAAAELADQTGVESVTMASLAKKLNVRSPSLYNHINGMQGLRKMLALHGIDQLNKRMLLAVAGRSRDEAVQALARAYLGFVREHPGLYDALFMASEIRDEEMRAKEYEVAELVVRVLQGYSLQEDKALHYVRVFRSLVHGFASLEQRGGFGLSLDTDDSFQLAVQTLLAGIHQHGEKSG